jgi:amino acid transporter
MGFVDDRNRAQHLALVRGTAVFGVVTGLFAWIAQGKTAGLALLGSWLLMALLFALFPPKPTSTSD